MKITTADYNGTGTEGYVNSVSSTRLLDSGFVTRDITTMLADVTANSGCTLPVRDSYDALLKTNYDNGVLAELIDTQEEVGGYPVLTSTTPLADTDSDGMPDSWETANGLDANVADNNEDIDKDGYTNLEAYLNNTPTIISTTGKTIKQYKILIINQ